MLYIFSIGLLSYLNGVTGIEHMINRDIGYIDFIEGEPFVITQKCANGYPVYGPYVDLDPGSYVVEFGFYGIDPNGAPQDRVIAVIEIICDLASNVLARREIMACELQKGASSLFCLAFHLDRKKELEFRVGATGVCDLAIRLRRRLVGGGGSSDFPPQGRVAPSGGGNVLAEYGAGGDDRFSFSRFAALDRAIFEDDGWVPMFWYAGNAKVPCGNFGDALSPVVVAAMSGLASRLMPRDSPRIRILTAGTVVQLQQRGYVHIWGTGLDSKVDCFSKPTPQGYVKPADLKLRAHAVRGVLTRQSLLANGVDCPAVYGDPGWLLPNIIPPAPEKTHELGIIPHLSELERQSPDAAIIEEFKRYDIGDDSSIKIISTLHPQSWDGFVEKVREITSCRRIISTSFHGLIVPQAYGIPAMLFGFGNGRLIDCDMRDDAPGVDLRVRDFMLGAGRVYLPIYAQRREEITDWDDVIRVIDNVWEPLRVDIEPFVEAFPLTLRRREDMWRISDKMAAQIRF